MKPKRLRPHDWNAGDGWISVCARCGKQATADADTVSCISDAEAAERAEWRACAEAAARRMMRR